ncbi:MAG: hypothetical protein KGH84_01065, partial [Paracoccaceae bacterium]|nr:hypothetical protein [Paracoccaceae bacterium]
MVFDLSQVFNRIPRDRLADLGTTEHGRRLTLQLSCACHAEIFEFRPTVLVIDIRPGAPPANSPFEKMLDGTAGPGDIQGTMATVRPRPQPNDAMQIYDWRKGFPSFPTNAASSAPMGKLYPVPVAPAGARIVEAQTTLIKQLGRAAAQGLVNARVTPIETTPSPETPRPTTAPVSPPPPAVLPVQHLARVTAKTALDSEIQPNLPSQNATNGEACLPAGSIDVPMWGDQEPVSEQIEKHRQRLVGEFDKPSAAAVEGLAHLYIYLGFGAETRSLIDAMPVTLPDADVLKSLASIVDDKDPPYAGRLSGEMGCSGPEAMWSVLSRPTLTSSDSVNINAVVQAFSALPPHLRRLLGPRLAERFLAIHDLDTVRAIRDALVRAGRDPNPDAQLLNAQFDLAQGKTQEANAAIAKVAKMNGQSTPDALILLVDQAAKNGKPVDPPLIDSIAALAKQYRDTKIGRNLDRAHILALGSVNDFGAAFRELAALRSNPNAGAAGAETLWAMLAAKGQDADVLRYAMDAKAAPEASRKTHDLIASRLIGLGFPVAAKTWLDTFTSLTSDEETLRAKALVAQGSLDAAVKAASALTGDGAAQVLGEAYSGLGDHAAAAKAYAAGGEPTKQGAEAWRAQDWQAAAKFGAEPVRQAIKLALPGQAGGGEVVSTQSTAPPALATGAQKQGTSNVLANDRALVAES